MSKITYDEWCKRFELKRGVAAELLAECSEPDAELEFFDNGAVRNSDGDFIVKCDQVRAL